MPLLHLGLEVETPRLGGTHLKHKAPCSSTSLYP